MMLLHQLVSAAPTDDDRDFEMRYAMQAVEVEWVNT